jgi:hypothetical protein
VLCLLAVKNLNKSLFVIDVQYDSPWFLFSIEESPTPVAKRSSLTPINIETPEDNDQIQLPSTSSSSKSSTSSDIETKQPEETDDIHPEYKQEQSIRSGTDNQTKKFSIEQKSYNHDILVIQSQPPRVNNCQKIFDYFYSHLFYSLNLYLIYSLRYNFKQVNHRFIQHQQQ